MMMTTGTVVNGKVEGEGRPLREGSTVTVLTADFKPSLEQKIVLLESIQEADRGEVISGEALLRELGAT